MSETSIGKPCRKFVNPNTFVPQTFSVERPDSYDWTLVSADDVKFRINSSALTAHSDYFAALCGSGMSEQLSKTVEFSDIDSAALERFLLYVSAGSVTVGGDSFLSLVQLGCRFQCDSLTDILKRYLELDFLNVKQSDVSELFTSRIHPEMADICGKLIEKHLISDNMLDLSFDVVAIVLRRDGLVCSCEDRVHKYVQDYCERWELDADRGLVLLNAIRQPRLTLREFERAAMQNQGFRKTNVFETIAERIEFIDVIDEEQLRPRAGNDVHITMLWILESMVSVCELGGIENFPFTYSLHLLIRLKDLETRTHFPLFFQSDSPTLHSSPHLLLKNTNGIDSSVKSLVLRAQGGLRTISTRNFEYQDRCFLSTNDLFISGAFVAFANHLYCITCFGSFEKISFKKQGLVLKPQKERNCRLEDLLDIDRVLGVDYNGENFFLSCRSNKNPSRTCVLNCRIIDQDVLVQEPVRLPRSVSRLWARRMIYRTDFICVLTSDSEVVIYSADSDATYKLPPADDFKPKYVQIAAQGDKLYVFDYSECPVHLQDFSQPFSHFDKIRVYSLSQKTWIANYAVDMNRLRQSGYNELIDFNIDMYFIRQRLFFLWTYQGRLHIFRVDEEAGRTEHLINYEVPQKANGVILLPGYYNAHNDTTVLEKFMSSYCVKKLSNFGEDRDLVRKVAAWKDKYFDGVVGSGLFPNEFDDAWDRPNGAL